MSSRAELMTTEPWISVEDVAKHLGDSVHRWIEGRGLPAHKVLKLKLTEVGEWVRAGGPDAPDAHHGQKPRGAR